MFFFEFQNALVSNNVADDDIKKKEAIQKEAAITSLAALFLVIELIFFSDCTLKILQKIITCCRKNILQIYKNSNNL